MTLRLAALASVASALAFAAPSGATSCYGASGVLVACTANREVTRQCVYTGGTTCQWVVVNGPLCVGGTIGSSGYFQTVWC